MSKIYPIIIGLSFVFIIGSMVFVDHQYGRSVPEKCHAFKGDIIVDSFSKDTLIVTGLYRAGFTPFYTGSITARMKNGQTIGYKCGEYRIITDM